MIAVTAERLWSFILDQIAEAGIDYPDQFQQLLKDGMACERIERIESDMIARFGNEYDNGSVLQWAASGKPKPRPVCVRRDEWESARLEYRRLSALPRVFATRTATAWVEEYRANSLDMTALDGLLRDIKTWTRKKYGKDFAHDLGVIYDGTAANTELYSALVCAD